MPRPLRPNRINTLLPKHIQRSPLPLPQHKLPYVLPRRLHNRQPELRHGGSKRPIERRVRDAKDGTGAAVREGGCAGEGAEEAGSDAFTTRGFGLIALRGLVWEIRRGGGGLALMLRSLQLPQPRRDLR